MTDRAAKNNLSVGNTSERAQSNVYNFVVLLVGRVSSGRFSCHLIRRRPTYGPSVFPWIFLRSGIASCGFPPPGLQIVFVTRLNMELSSNNTGNRRAVGNTRAILIILAANN